MAEYIKTGYKRILKICPICKLETWMALNQKVCPGVCAKINNKLLQKESRERLKIKKKEIIIKPARAEWRKLTDLTEGLICIDDYRLKPVEWIAESLGRPAEQIKSILRKAKKSGRYEKYVEQLKRYHKVYYNLQERGAI